MGLARRYTVALAGIVVACQPVPVFRRSFVNSTRLMIVFSACLLAGRALAG